MISNRDLRQRQILPPEKLEKVTATVVGVGAIGRQVALQLATIGMPKITLIDHDTVEPHNLSAQGYLESDLGESKVVATARMCRQLNSATVITEHNDRFGRSMDPGRVLFCCVDSISTRRFIFDAVKERVSLFVDGRMAAEVLRVLTAHDAPSREYYPTTLFAEAETYRGSCTAQTTFYCASIAAGLMVAQFAKWLRGMGSEPDSTLNLLSFELFSLQETPA